MSNKLLATLLLLITFAGLATAGIIARPTKTTPPFGTGFTDGTTPHASDFNGDADTIYTLVNGALDNSNIAVGAAIAGSKITPNFTANVQVTTGAVPCFVNIDSSLGGDLKQWRICQSAGVLSIATYTDAGAIIITPLTIARATGLMTNVGGFTTNGALTMSALTAKSFIYLDGGKGLASTSAPTNGQMLIGNTGNNPTLGTITGTATHVCTTLGAGTFALDFCANPTLTSPVLAGTPTGSWTSPAFTTPVLTGTVTGTYTLGGTPTYGTGTVSGTLTGGTLNPATLTLTNPRIINPAASVYVLDEFVGKSITDGTIGSLGWHFTGVGTPTISCCFLAANHPGNVQVTTSTANADSNLLSLTPTVVDAGQIGWDATAIFEVTTTVANSDGRVGLADALNAPNTGLYLEALAADATWFCVARNSGSQTRTNTTVNKTISTFVRVKLRQSGADAGCTVNNNSETTMTTNLPAAAALSPGFYIIARTAAAANMVVDFFDFQATTLTR